MKLRIRSTETKEKIRVDAPETANLLDLKTLIGSQLSSPDGPAHPEFIRLSLNRTDELVASSSEDTLQTLGLTSGDLLFYTLTSSSDSTPQFPKRDSAPVPLPVPVVETLNPLSSAAAVAMELTDPPAASLPEPATDDDMEVEPQPSLPEKAPSIPCFLRRVMKVEKGEIKGNMGLTVVAVHAVFLESGFVACGANDGSRLPEGCTTASHLVKVRYSLPDLLDRVDVEYVRSAILKFSAVGNYVSVYGSVDGNQSEVYRLCLDSSKLAPLLVSSADELDKKEEEEVFKLWKIVKDGLCTPLLIDICQKNGLLLPPCFARVPTDIKIMILELLPGIDLAKAACASSELRYLSSNEELWRRKVMEEFGMLVERNTGGSWKESFARFWVRRKKVRIYTRDNPLVPYVRTPRIMPAPWAPSPYRFPMIGGDYDRFPAIGDLGTSRRTGFRQHPASRTFSPQCNFGGGSSF
ncbi:F-box protein SKIP22 [Apostasia shenzhenica]|uniref:F-box protein SKIP22 n=1 Tax=Apostasia shenzhenica TaxID=1088818 RepID=A0A2I0BFE6_9ASPA|nr:F-box protein SKIP22 [Apostasia shenzhenica]